ncbi:MAG: MetQ/NlpA family ABC transporter substrate-binding protein [Clostridiales bacterium]|nr:MetQ/NlpA family ABC transporter substrate-binding protein [Clostridiales bacterium]
MKKFLSLVLAALLTLSCTAAFAEGIKIAVPNDPTNEGRALLLLQANGYIKLDPDAGVTATAKNVIENPLGIEFVEVEAAMVPNVLPDVDYAIINNNFALDFGLNPVADSLLIESAESPYANVLCVNAGNEDSDAAKALAAALNSQKVADYITTTYNGAAVSVVAEPTDGYDATVDYDKLAGTTISVAASPTPHAQILAVAAEILKEKNITLKIVEFSDYVQPNMVVDAGEIFANYFAHIPYQENFNAENGTNIVVVAPIHVEPMGLYGGQQKTLDALNAK